MSEVRELFVAHLERQAREVERTYRSAREQLDSCLYERRSLRWHAETLSISPEEGVHLSDLMREREPDEDERLLRPPRYFDDD